MKKIIVGMQHVILDGEHRIYCEYNSNLSGYHGCDCVNNRDKIREIINFIDEELNWGWNTFDIKPEIEFIIGNNKFADLESAFSAACKQSVKN